MFPLVVVVAPQWHLPWSGDVAQRIEPNRRHRSGELLTLQALRDNLPKAWLAEWAISRERQVNEARRRRGLR